MIKRPELTESERRRLLVLVGVMTVIVTVFTSGPIPARVLAGIVMGIFSAIVFLATTALLGKLGVNS